MRERSQRSRKSFLVTIILSISRKIGFYREMKSYEGGGPPSSSMGCCSWRQTCCGGGCCVPSIPSKCHSAEQENVRRSQKAMADSTYDCSPSETTMNGTTMASIAGRNGTIGNIDFFKRTRSRRRRKFTRRNRLVEISLCYLIRDEGRHIIANNIET